MSKLAILIVMKLKTNVRQQFKMTSNKIKYMEMCKTKLV